MYKFHQNYTNQLKGYISFSLRSKWTQYIEPCYVSQVHYNQSVLNVYKIDYKIDFFEGTKLLRYNGSDSNSFRLSFLDLFLLWHIITAKKVCTLPSYVCLLNRKIIITRSRTPSPVVMRACLMITEVSCLQTELYAASL